MTRFFILILFGLFWQNLVWGQTQTYESYMKQGKQKLIDKEYNRAIVDFTIALEIDPRIEGFIVRANAKRKIDDLEGALNDYDEAINMDTSNAVLYNNRGNIKDELKRVLDAIKDYDNAIRLDSSYTNAYYNRAIARYHAKRYEAAKTDFKKVIDLQPDDAEALVGLGLSECKLENIEKACTYFIKAKQLNLEDAEKYLEEYCQ